MNKLEKNIDGGGCRCYNSLLVFCVRCFYTTITLVYAFEYSFEVLRVLE